MATVTDLITAEALRQGVDPKLALAVAWRESHYQQSARGTSGEIGVFQLMPGTAKDLQVNPADLPSNIRGGVSYLAQQLRRFGNVNQALQAYNGGPGNVQRGTVSAAARQYAAEVSAAAGVAPVSSPVSAPDAPVAMPWDSWNVEALGLGGLSAVEVALGVLGAVALLLVFSRKAG